MLFACSMFKLFRKLLQHWDREMLSNLLSHYWVIFLDEKIVDKRKILYLKEKEYIHIICNYILFLIQTFTSIRLILALHLTNVDNRSDYTYHRSARVLKGKKWSFTRMSRHLSERWWDDERRSVALRRDKRRVRYRKRVVRANVSRYQRQPLFHGESFMSDR